jgi:hypothetical protein
VAAPEVAEVAAQEVAAVAAPGAAVEAALGAAVEAPEAEPVPEAAPVPEPAEAAEAAGSFSAVPARLAQLHPGWLQSAQPVGSSCTCCRHSDPARHQPRVAW